MALVMANAIGAPTHLKGGHLALQAREVDVRVLHGRAPLLGRLHGRAPLLGRALICLFEEIQLASEGARPRELTGQPTRQYLCDGASVSAVQTLVRVTWYDLLEFQLHRLTLVVAPQKARSWLPVRRRRANSRMFHLFLNSLITARRGREFTEGETDVH